jgi:hypothetical protein
MVQASVVSLFQYELRVLIYVSNHILREQGNEVIQLRSEVDAQLAYAEDDGLGPVRPFQLI